MMRDNVRFHKEMQEDHHYIVCRDPVLKRHYAAETDVAVAMLLASNVEQSKAWAQGYRITALALALHTDIVLINTCGCEVYAYSLDCWTLQSGPWLVRTPKGSG